MLDRTPLRRLCGATLAAALLFAACNSCGEPARHAADARDLEGPDVVSIYFSRDSPELSDFDRTRLELLVERLRENPDSMWVVSGHAADSESAETNFALSERRAQAIQDYLAARAEVPRDHLLVQGWGEARPLCQEADPWCTAQNRRGMVFGPFAPDTVWQTAFEQAFQEAARRAPTPQWSKWTERDGATVGTLEPGRNYEVFFDYSAYDYAQLLDATGSTLADWVTTSTATPDLAHEVAEAEKEAEAAGRPGTGQVALWVQPVLLGDGIEFRPGAGTAQRVEIDLGRLASSLWGVHARTPAELSGAVGALKADDGAFRPIRVEIEARSEGCAAVALSIWNEHPDKPLDYVQQVLTVGSARCERARAEEPLGRKLLRLFGDKGDQPLAGAGLQVFEMELDGELRAVAVLLIRGPQGSAVEFHSWQLPESLSSYVSHEQKLLLALKNARNAAGGYDFSKVSNSLKDAIFSGRRPTIDSPIATEARKEFERFGRRQPVQRFYAKLVDRSGASLFLPLGLFEFGDGTPFGSRAEIVQPLFEEDFRAKQCVRSWNLVLPEKLDGLDDSYLTLAGPAPGTRISRWAEFESYLGTQPTAARPEGLLLLAHHSDGAVWFREALGSKSHGQLSRVYPDGSVAIMVSCAVGDLGDLKANEDRLGWVRRLQDLHVDAVILSPFEVNAKYGARFAIHFADQLGKAKTDQSLLSLFKATIEAVEKDKMVQTIKASPYEFLIAGNGELQICPPGGDG